MDNRLTHLDLFSGIGGFGLAARWNGLKTIQFVEIDPFCRKVLTKNFPGVPIHDDIKTFTLDTYVNSWYKQPSQDRREIVDMGAKRKDFDEAVRLYDSGLSIQNVADFYGMSRQAMWQVLQRRGCQFRDNLKYGADNHFHRGGIRASDKAQNLLEEAIERGIVVRKVLCEKCGEAPVFADGRTGIQAHHNDYNKPLDVQWLCQPCHHEWHKNNKAIERKEVAIDEVTGKTISPFLLTGGFP